MGILVALAVTAGAVAFVANASTVNESSMQLQGEIAIARTTAELKEIPQHTEEFIEESIEVIEESVEEVESVAEYAEETITQGADEIVEEIEETIPIPEVPDVVKQTNSNEFLIEVSIAPMTDTPGCEENNLCYIPSPAQISSGGGEVIWTNNDLAMHTVTSGNARDGPNGLFDSQLIGPDESYSIDFGIPGEYEYFCMIHPWMTGTVIVS